MRLLSTVLRPASFALVTCTRNPNGKRSCRYSVSSLAAFVGPSPSPPSILEKKGEPTIHQSVVEIVDLYDAFILDQFGVLHNGVRALDGAIEAVTLLNSKHKKLIILSNTSAPAKKALAKLPTFGFDGNHFIDAVTSGEEASRYVRETYNEQKCADTVKALFFTWDAIKPNNPRLTAPPKAFLDQCGGNVQVTANIEDADLLLLHGSEVWYRGDDVSQEALGSFIKDGDFSVVDPLLRRCLERNLPMVCANPDLVVVTPSGGTAYMPGKIAQRYRELGALPEQCKVFGKPDTEHFEACLRILGMLDQRDRVAHVGDSLSHDVAGAASAGIPSVFVTSGIHAQQLGTSFGEMPSRSALQQLWKSEGNVVPTHVVAAFRV